MTISSGVKSNGILYFFARRLTMPHKCLLGYFCRHSHSLFLARSLFLMVHAFVEAALRSLFASRHALFLSKFCSLFAAHEARFRALIFSLLALAHARWRSASYSLLRSLHARYAFALSDLSLIGIILAHSFYPSQCCGGQDCRPIDCSQLVEQSNGRWLYIPTHNEFSPEQVYPSQDRFCHVCVSSGADHRSLCAFIQMGT